MAYTTSFRFDSIYFIESIPAGQLRTGNEVFERVVMPWRQREGTTDVQHENVINSAQLFDLLDSLADHARRLGRLPILVLDAHGNKQGIELSSGEHVEWRLLAEPLAIINEASRFNLLIVASMCFGSYMQTALIPADRSPAWAIIAPHKKLQAGQLLDANLRFFETFLSTRDLRKGMDAANQGLPFKSWFMDFLMAEVLFCHVYRYYLRHVASDEMDEARTAKIVAALVRETGMDLIESGVARATIRALLKDDRYWYERLRHSFLMLDTFPENASRFDLPYERCRNLPIAKRRGK
jgi:hypothetical protein